MTACPWEGFRQAELPFCEAELCSWIREPANTWSNLAFLIVAVIVVRKSGRAAKAIALVSAATGLGSALFHATGTQWGGIADYAGMFLGTGAMTALNVRRWRSVSWPFAYFLFALTSVLLLAGAAWFPELERILYIVAMPCCLIELRLWFRDRGTRYFWYLIGSLVLSIGVLFWWLDLSRVFCNPDNHWINGHAIWHLATALALYSLHRFYEQFPSLNR